MSRGLCRVFRGGSICFKWKVGFNTEIAEDTEKRTRRNASGREAHMSHECCEGVRGLKFSRRYFLKQGGVAMVGLSAMPAFLQRAVAATFHCSSKRWNAVKSRGA